MVFPLRARSLSPTIWMFTDKYDIVMQLIISFSHRDVLLPVSGRVDVTFAFKISIFLLTIDLWFYDGLLCRAKLEIRAALFLE